MILRSLLIVYEYSYSGMCILIVGVFLHSYVYSYIWYVCSYLVCIHTLVCVFLSGVYFDTGMRILITWGGYH